jgi:hypothetical protein
VATLPSGATFSAADKYAEKSSVLPKLLLVAFGVWFVWAFLNDKDGRLYRWTKGEHGKPPTVAATSGTVTNTVTSVVSTNLPVAK